MKARRLGTLLLGFVACGEPERANLTPSATNTVSASATVAPSPEAAPRAKRPTPNRSGASLARSVDGKRLYVADEDHRVLRILEAPINAEAEGLPADPKTPEPKRDPPAEPPHVELPPPPAKANQTEVTLPGAPANVLALDGRVLVTVRDPGLLLVMREVEGSLREEARVPIAADAWGLAVDPKESVALVTSAWTHSVSAVDISVAKPLWSQSVGREPRGVVIHPDGKRAYVSHLTSGALTRIDEIGSDAPKTSVVLFPAAPNRAPSGFTLTAALGYALVIDDNGHRLLAARHAMGGLGERAWAGLPTVDVLQTANDTPLLAPRQPSQPLKATAAFTKVRKTIEDNKEVYRQDTVEGAFKGQSGIVQPRAMIVRHKTNTVWVASEGHDRVFELSLQSAAPA